jgi:hypothetical protein
MKILIPPSEGKAKVRSQDILFKDTKFQFSQYTQQIVDLLCLIENEDLTSVYGTTQDKAIMFHRQNQDVFNSKCVPAIKRYTGVVYNHIDWASLSSKAKNYMEKHTIIFSGLFGLLTPDTLIPDYKLKMNVLSLQHHWSPIISEALDKEDVIFDLLPQVYRKAYNPGKNVIQIEFKVEREGKKTAAGHFGKAVKGKFIKYLADHQITDIKDFSGFEYDGFKWVEDHFVKIVK